MPKERTEKSRYKHQSTGEYCTAGAFIAEKMCLHYAEYKNVGSLSYKFWNRKPWDWTFKKQLWEANKLIKRYGEKAMIKAVTSPEFLKIFSLKNKRGIKIIEKYKKIVDAESESRQELDVQDNPTRRKKKFGKKTGLNKLRELDG